MTAAAPKPKRAAPPAKPQISRELETISYLLGLREVLVVRLGHAADSRLIVEVDRALAVAMNAQTAPKKAKL